MRVCDQCRDLTKPVLDLRLMLLKPDPENNRLKPEELQGVGVELCKDCVPDVWSSLLKSLTLPKT